MGENPSVAEVSGISVARTRYLCVTVGGMLMGLAGAIYSLDYNPVWNYNFLMGWGFIALALVFFSMWNPFILLGRIPAVWNPVAALAQPATRASRSHVQIPLEDGSLCHHHWRAADHVDQVVQDQGGVRRNRKRLERPT